MGIEYQVIGNMVAEWNDAAPLKWKMSETFGRKNDRRTETKSFDISGLREGYEEAFLQTFKDLLISRRKRVSLSTIHHEYLVFRNVLGKVQLQQKGNPKVFQIDHCFLVTLKKMCEDFGSDTLSRFKRFFNSNPESPLYAHEITQGDFPIKQSTKSQIGENIDRVLAKALGRAACVEVLRRSEDAYESGVIDIGCFAFVHLAFHIYCRPSSYHRLTLSDLQVDLDPQTQVKTYFIWVIPKKTRVSTQSLKKIAYRLDNIVGELLEAQRIVMV